MNYRVSSVLIAWHERAPELGAPSRAQLAELDQRLKDTLEPAVIQETQARGMNVSNRTREILVVLAAASNGASARAKAAAACQVLAPFLADVEGEGHVLEALVAAGGAVAPKAASRRRAGRRRVAQTGRRKKTASRARARRTATSRRKTK